MVPFPSSDDADTVGRMTAYPWPRCVRLASQAARCLAGREGTTTQRGGVT